MKSRLTAWLSALLLITAVFGLPVARVQTNSVACYQVYCEHGKTHRAEQCIAAAPAPIIHAVFRTAALPDRFATPFRDHSLFQRPPPSSSL